MWRWFSKKGGLDPSAHYKFSSYFLSLFLQIEQVDSNQNHCGSCLGILEQDQILNVVNQVT